MEQKSKFDKVMGAWDILVIAFGAMIGWGWVINSGDWITTAGFMGSIIAMLIGGLMVFFVGLTYAELTSAMPQCGGEHVFSYRAMGPTGSFICTWMIVLGYVATSAFEATALPTVITYLFPDFNQVYLYTIAGKDIYLTTIILGVGVAVLITWVNIKGAKTAAMLQTILTAIIALGRYITCCRLGCKWRWQQYQRTDLGGRHRKYFRKCIQGCMYDTVPVHRI